LEIESLFSSTRWEILRELSQRKLSPMELASALNTTSANISQQLRLLELGGLVKSEKTSNVDKGKPRVIYSLEGENAYLIYTGKNFAEKKLISLSLYHKFMMKSWFLENPEHQRLMPTVYEALLPYMSKIEAVAASSGTSLNIYIVGKQFNISIEKVRLSFVSMDDLKKKTDTLVLYREVEE
jgi:predicted transcriptional regulator